MCAGASAGVARRPAIRAKLDGSRARCAGRHLSSRVRAIEAHAAEERWRAEEAAEEERRHEPPLAEAALFLLLFLFLFLFVQEAFFLFLQAALPCVENS